MLIWAPQVPIWALMVLMLSSPFGGQTRTRTLVALALLGSSHARELARDGLVAGRLVGRSRVVSLDPRYFARVELAAYLARLADGDEELRRAVSELRRRPRRADKPL